MKRTSGIEGAVRQLRVTTHVTLDARILDDARAALNQATSRPSVPIIAPWERVALRFLRVAAGVALVGAVAIVAIVLWNRTADESRQVATDPKEHTGPNRPTETPGPDRPVADERPHLEALYVARDVGGLVRALEEVSLESQLLAAAYLGEIGDARALPALSRLAEQWQGDPTENPFTRATEQIRSRENQEDVEPDVPGASQEPRGVLVPETRSVSVLSGTITDRDTGQPVKGVEVHISPRGGGRVYTATSDDVGRYAFESVGSEGVYNVRLKALDHIVPEGWRTPHETVELRRDAAMVRDYALEAGAKVVIAVVDEEGRPVEGVRFYAAYVSDSMGRGPRDPIRSDTDGTAVIGGLPPTEYLITAAHRDYAVAGQKVLIEDRHQFETVTFTLQRGIDIVGVATCSDDLPASGWQIEARPRWWHGVYCPFDYAIAEDGTFVLEHILPGDYQLGIQIPEEGGSRGICSIDASLPPQTDVFDLRIPKPSPHGRVSISGTVRFTGGDYEEGFWIYARSDAGHYGSTYLRRGGNEFTLTDLVPGRYAIDVTLAGQRHLFDNIQAPCKGVVLEIAIAAPVPLSGQVVDGTTRRPLTEFELKIAGERQWQRISDPDGRFEIESRMSQDARVTIRAEGYDDQTVQLSPDTNTLTVVAMAAPLVLTGTVVDETGLPIAGVTVSYRHQRSTDEVSAGKEVAVTDAEGCFAVTDVPASDTYHWFVFRHPDHARGLRYIEMADKGVTETSVVLGEGGAVEGYVYDRQGRPLPETDVYFMDEKHFPLWEQNRGRLGKVTTDGAGYYRIDHLPEERCYAFRDDPDNQFGVVLSAVVPRAGQTMRLDLGGTWKVSGRLVRAGEPLANTPLLVSYAAGEAQGFKAYALSDALGHFSFCGLPAGQRHLYWAVPGARGGEKWVRLTTVDFERGGGLDLGDLEAVTAEVTVTLVVSDDTVLPDPRHVTIRERRTPGSAGRRVGRLQIRRDDSDPFIFSGLGVGHYEVLVSRKGYPTVRQSLEIVPGQQHSDVAVTIPCGTGRISGTVVSAEGARPLPVLLQSADGHLEALVTPRADGTFELAHLPPGDYRFTHPADARSSTAALARVHLDPGEHETVRAQAEREGDRGYLAVLMVTPEGLPLATPDVWLERGEQIIEPYADADDGKSFTGPPGIYTLRAQYAGYEPVHHAVELRAIEGRTRQEIFEPLVVTMIEP
ncbi:MAG: carboxypeptidase regulatory-like domain-containing protein [Phycisphaerales bacterium]|nr:MAG: carboxypeptidase regulatory-like domain-containing protein [Phycisphaerales bacterium]